MTDVIREALQDQGIDAAAVPVLYGGSVTSAAIGEFLAEPGIDGALVGGASLKVDEMATMPAISSTFRLAPPTSAPSMPGSAEELSDGSAGHAAAVQDGHGGRASMP